jgi:hydroxypyruvate isomerase
MRAASHDPEYRRLATMLNRREFLGLGLAGSAALVGLQGLRRRSTRFARNYAPQLGLFVHHAGSDPIDQSKFLQDEGFGAVADSGLRGKSPKLQSRVGEELARRGLAFGPFLGVAHFGRPTFASGSLETRRELLRETGLAIDAARRVGGADLIVIPGKGMPHVPETVQFRRAVDTLKFSADACERHGIRMLLEPTISGGDTSRMFLRSVDQAAQLCRAVGGPACRLLFDVFDQAITGQDVPELLRRSTDVLGSVQLADAPSRQEPGSGEIDFRRLFDVLDAIGYQGILGMEHGKRLSGREGERAVIDAYVTLDRSHQRPSPAARAAARQRSTSAAVKSNTSIV